MSTEQDPNNLGPDKSTSNDVQKLVDYISNLSMIMADADRDQAYKFLFQKSNLDLIQSFASKETIVNLCFVVNEDENPEPNKEFFLESDPTIKPFPTTTIILIKKIPYLDCSDTKIIKRDLQILNFSSEGNDSSIMNHIQNCIQNAFGSLFNSYQESLKQDKTSAIKSSNAIQLQSKFGELVDIMNKTTKTSNIPIIKLEYEPELKLKMDKIRQEGREPTLDELSEGLSDDYINKLCDIINRWKADISNVIKMDREVKDGDTLEEVNFWIDYEKALNAIKKQVEAPEVQMTLAIAKKANKVFVTKGFEEDTKTDTLIKKAESYNILLKDLPIQAMYNSGSIADLVEQIKRIFEVIKNKMKISAYPSSRIYQLVENLSNDLYNHLLKLLGSNLMKMEYKDFITLYKQCKELFKNVWTPEFESLRKEVSELVKKRRETIAHIPNNFAHDELYKRLKDLKKFRSEHEKLIDIAKCLEKSADGEETQIIKDIRAAYEASTEIDILDLSKKGSDSWAEAKNEYNKVIDKIEGQISSSLIDQLASAQNANEQYRIFEKFKLVIKRPRIQSSIQEYQRSLINNIIKDLTDLKDKYDAGYQKSSAAKLCKIRGIPLISGEIIWMNQFEEKANSYRTKITNLLGESWEDTEEGKKVKELIENFKKISSETDKKIKAWGQEGIDAKRSNKKFNENENILYIEGNYGNYKLKVNINDSLSEFKECRLIKNIRNNISKTIINNSNKNKVNYPFALAIQDAFRTFNSSCQKIKNEPKINKLIAQQKNEIHDLIRKNANLTWANDQKLKSFTKAICEKVSSFEEKVSELINKITQIDNLLQQIVKSPLNKEVISENIQSIQKVIDQVMNCSNIEKWIKEIDSKLESILIKKLEECIDIWIKEFLAPKPLNEPVLILDVIVHKIKMENQTIILEPSIYDAREYWFNQLHQAMSIIISNKRLSFRYSAQKAQDDPFKEITYRDIISKIDQKLLLDVYSSLEKKFNECEEYVKTWVSYQVLWEIQPQIIYDKLGEDMDKWQQLMNELKQGRKTFDTGENEKTFGAIIIDYSSVQNKVNNKYDTWHKEIMNQFALETNEGMKQFSKNLNDAKSVLDQNALDNASSDIVAFITQISQVKQNLDKWQADMDKYKNSHGILVKQKYKFPNDFVKIENIEKEWNKFKQILKQKSDAMEEQIPGIKARILAEESNINERIQKLEQYWAEKKPDRADNPSEALEILNEAKSVIEEVRDVYVKNCKAKELLGLDYGDPNKLDNLSEEIKDLEDVWGELNKIYSKIDEQKDTPFAGVNADKIKKDLDEALNKINELPEKYHSYEAFDITNNKLQHLKKMNNLIGDLRTDAIKDRHWKVILNSLNIKKAVKDLILNDFWKSDLLKKEKEVQETINQAAGELVLESYIKKSKDFWKEYELELVRYKDKCKLIKGWDDMFTALDEDINSFQSMSNSPYYNQFKDDIEPWKDKLEQIRLIFNEWVDVQRKWVYLEGIFFGSADIMNELASDYNKFKSIDEEFTGLMKKVANKPMVLEVINIPSIKIILEEKLKTALERIQKALYNFLEKQRQNFARFYFIGDEDLLEIIGNSKDVNKITRHFNKMFAGMNSLLSEDGDELTGMVSREFEEVQFETSVKISDDPVVYQWLRKVQEQMQLTLAIKLERAVNEISEMDYIGKVDDFIKWIEQYPAQITVLSSQVLWSASIEAALTGQKTLKALPDGFTLDSEENVINNMLSALSDQVLKDIKVDMRKKLEQLITELVHQRDVVRLLKSKQVSNVEAFEWLYYMRFYFYPKTEDVLKR